MSVGNIFFCRLALRRNAGELFKKQGTVVFSSSEVEKIGTQSSEFDPAEVGVITADKQVRSARFNR